MPRACALARAMPRSDPSGTLLQKQGSSSSSSDSEAAQPGHRWRGAEHGWAPPDAHQPAPAQQRQSRRNLGGLQPLTPYQAMTNTSAPTPARTDGCPGVLPPRPKAEPPNRAQPVPACARPQQSPGQRRCSQLSVHPCALLAASSSLGSAELLARGKPWGGMSQQHRSDTRTPTRSPTHPACACPGTRLEPPHPPAEELLRRHCKKTWEITHACDISN